MLGYRGIRRSLDRPDLFAHELEAFRWLFEMGYDNVKVVFSLVNDSEDVLAAKALLEDVGIDPSKRRWGVMVETPASALGVETMCEAGVNFAWFGTNDLTQYTLTVDRNDGNIADQFDELHPVVLTLIGGVIATYRTYDVAPSICRQAGSKSEMVYFLVNKGTTSISANTDAVPYVPHEVKRVEQKLLLNEVR